MDGTVKYYSQVGSAGRSQQAATLATPQQRRQGIAAVWRGFYDTYKGPAATLIQSYWRGYATRKRAHACKHGRLLRAVPPTQPASRDAAARVIQRHWRGWTVRQAACVQRLAILCIQRRWRGFAARNQFPAMRAAWRWHNEAALVLQCATRCWIARRHQQAVVAAKIAALANQAVTPCLQAATPTYQAVTPSHPTVTPSQGSAPLQARQHAASCSSALPSTHLDHAPRISYCAATTQAHSAPCLSENAAARCHCSSSQHASTCNRNSVEMPQMETAFDSIATAAPRQFATQERSDSGAPRQFATRESSDSGAPHQAPTYDSSTVEAAWQATAVDAVGRQKQAVQHDSRAVEAMQQTAGPIMAAAVLGHMCHSNQVEGSAGCEAGESRGRSRALEPQVCDGIHSRRYQPRLSQSLPQLPSPHAAADSHRSVRVECKPCLALKACLTPGQLPALTMLKATGTCMAVPCLRHVHSMPEGGHKASLAAAQLPTCSEHTTYAGVLQPERGESQNKAVWQASLVPMPPQMLKTAAQGTLPSVAVQVQATTSHVKSVSAAVQVPTTRLNPVSVSALNVASCQSVSAVSAPSSAAQLTSPVKGFTEGLHQSSPVMARVASRGTLQKGACTSDVDSAALRAIPAHMRSSHSVKSCSGGERQTVWSGCYQQQQQAVQSGCYHQQQQQQRQGVCKHGLGKQSIDSANIPAYNTIHAQVMAVQPRCTLNRARSSCVSGVKESRLHVASGGV